ncbi:hypothetical protein H310_00954 [Aphanomyces invadans]|uniref:Uncharacterized protein n=1 Tax=Aphanomyces invadans TaxID=157072 RepID=A0A024UPJ3_9STRA|nr:hypothetical protein H310_00954 [Aphanomyces invadans]ETW08356.1 hypothetical protein H310_00954 [Aphanomyces invadans]|eukprot:XP_008862161.1 hypothetical protein H310_00954 [Aphanomyces invadans]
MVDVDLAQAALNAMHMRDPDGGDAGTHHLDADSVFDPTDRRFGIESSNLLQEYYPRTHQVDPPRKPTIDLFDLPFGLPSPVSSTTPRSVAPRARAKSAHPSTRPQSQQVREMAVHLLVPFENNLDASLTTTSFTTPSSSALPPRKASDLAPPDVKSKKPAILEPAITPTPRPPQRNQLRPSTGGTKRRPIKLNSDLVWSSSKCINTLEHRRPKVAPPLPAKQPGTARGFKQSLLVHLVPHVNSDMVLTVGQASTKVKEDALPIRTHLVPPAKITLETSSAITPQLARHPQLRPASADATRVTSTTKILTKHRRELHQRILTHRSVVERPQDVSSKNQLLKMYCVLDEYHDGKFVKRLKQKPEIPMQKKPAHRNKSSRLNKETSTAAPHIYLSNQESAK